MHTRGTGKTTVAKILAKAVNCEHPVDGEPCGECEVCKAIAEGSSMNVIEIDAASNNGVDNIREIKEQVQYSKFLSNTCRNISSNSDYRNFTSIFLLS